MMAYLLFLFGALLAVILGADFVLNRFLLSSAIILTALISLNYSNDYFDTDIDQHNRPTSVSGGSGILVEHPELREFSKRFSLILMSLSIILAIFFTILFNYSIFFLVLVVLGNLLTWFYAAPPLKLSFIGLSEISTIIGVGVMVLFAGYFTMMPSFDIMFLFFDIPFIFYAFSFIISVEIPDMEGDALGQKNTLVVRKGRKFGFIVIALSSFLATLSFTLIHVINLVQALIDLRLIAFFSLLPLTFGILGLIKRTDERDLATKLVTYNVLSIFFFLLISNFYLIFLVWMLN